MTESRYQKMDEFVDSMNESASRVGDMSIYLFNNFRSGIGWIFIMITTMAIAFIVAEFVRKFELSPIMGVEMYHIAMATGVIAGGLIAYWAEEAKIATIKGAVFSEGANRWVQILASLAVVAVLVLANANGVQKIADFSLRYMNTELQESVTFKIKQEKMKVHQNISTTQSIDTSDIDALMRTRGQMEESRDGEISATKTLRDNYINNRDAREYRTMIAFKKAECAKTVSKISSKWNKEIAKVDWKISQSKSKNIASQQAMSEKQSEELEKADLAADELMSFYDTKSAENALTIQEYAGIGLIVAISGEVIDAVLAMLLFVLVKSNPNTNGTPKVDINTRALPPRVVAPARKVHTISKKESSPKPQAHSTHSQKRVGRELFDEIDRVARVISEQQDEHIKGNLKHATQRQIRQAFTEQGRSVTPLEIQEYFNLKGEGLIFINQKVGFVYHDRVKEVA